MLQKLRVWTRAQRRARFAEFLPAQRPLRIVDLGGTVPFWRGWGLKPEDQLHITLINNHHIDTTAAGFGNQGSQIVNRVFDANDVTTKYLASFDLIFSNSFLEHLDSRQAQAHLAAKICDSGKPYFIQVPNKNSPVDPHFPTPLAPFFAIYPRSVQAALLTRSRLGSGAKSTDINDAMERMRFYNPLGLNDMRTLFPVANFAIERPLGVPMSILAWRDNWPVAAANKNSAPPTAEVA
ncbi:hypothetical protein [Vitreimonas flagellata]|uniref:hypothetical protein n=1 Tax=Vitreimonas flagellata TaxID=2560861 RepID=UPI0010755406|nr:hypothetical protein [Vitreimonas flagellata]